MGAPNGDGVAVFAVSGEVGTLGRSALRVTQAAFGAAPLGKAALVVIAIGKQDIVTRAEGMAVLIVAASGAQGGIGITLVSANVDHAQGPGFPDEVQTGLLTEGGIGDDGPDLQPGEASLQGGEVVWENSRVALVGWSKGGRQVPVGGQVSIQDLPAVAVVLVC